jgi:hypothetical protein
MPNKKEVKKNDYYKAIGLIELVKQKNKELKNIEKALAETLGVEDDFDGYYGHVSDCVYGQLYDVDTLFRKLNIKLEVE